MITKQEQNKKPISDQLTQAKRDFIYKGAKVLNYTLDKAIGVKSTAIDLKTFSGKNHAQIVEDLMLMLHAHNQIEKVKIGSVDEIVQQVGKGKITLNDAEKLIKLLNADNVLDEQAIELGGNIVHIGIKKGGAV